MWTALTRQHECLVLLALETLEWRDHANTDNATDPFAKVT